MSLASKVRTVCKALHIEIHLMDGFIQLLILVTNSKRILVLGPSMRVAVLLVLCYLFKNASFGRLGSLEVFLFDLNLHQYSILFYNLFCGSQSRSSVTNNETTMPMCAISPFPSTADTLILCYNGIYVTEPSTSQRESHFRFGTPPLEYPR